MPVNPKPGSLLDVLAKSAATAPSKTQQLTVRFEPADVKRLNRLAKKLGARRANVIRQLVKWSLDQVENGA